MVVVSEVVLAFLKSAIKFLWEYKALVVVGALIVSTFYYKEMLEFEKEQHDKTILEYKKKLSDQQADWLVQITEIRLANEQALRVAQEESAANYKELVEKTRGIQEKYNERNKDINATITKLNSSNNSLQQTISEYTKRNSNSSEGSVRDTSDADSLFIISGLLETCSTESIYYANEAAKLSNSVKTLQEWGSLVVGGDKELN